MDGSITVTYPVQLSVDIILTFYDNNEKRPRIEELFKKAEADDLIDDEIDELKSAILDAADHYFERSSIKPVIHDSSFDILID